MANPSLDLRGGASGPSFEGSTPGHVLTVDANGKTCSPQPVPVAPGGLVSFNGRTTPAAMPEAGDYEADQIPYAGNAPGADVEAALDGVQDEIDDLQTDVDAAAAAAAAAGAAAATAQGTANAAGAAAVTADAKAVAAQQPFLGTYFVNPAFTGTQLGSQSNPFTTIAAAFAFAASLAITKGIIFLAPGATAVETVTFPTTGDWEIAAQPTQGSHANASITGNVDISATASARRALTRITVTGNVTGNCSAGVQRVLVTAVTVTGTLTLTATGAGVNRLGSGSTIQEFTGFGILQNNFAGAVTVAGSVHAMATIFFVSLSFTQTSSVISCLMPPTTTLAGAGTADLWAFGCSNTIGGSLTFVASGGGALNLRPDGVTINEWSRVGTIRTGNVKLFAANGARSFGGTQLSNASAAILGPLPAGLQVCEACLTLLTNAGATAGNAVLNITYTDATGTLVTEPVTTALNVAGAVGSKARGVLPYSQNGATSPTWSVTGITNSTSLTYRVDVAVRQAS